jgi:hypothetical protein
LRLADANLASVSGDVNLKLDSFIYGGR